MVNAAVLADLIALALRNGTKQLVAGKNFLLAASSDL